MLRFFVFLLIFQFIFFFPGTCQAVVTKLEVETTPETNLKGCKMLKKKGGRK